MGRCQFCQSDQLREFQAEEKMLGLGDTFIYQECLACRSLQIKDIPTDLSRYYSQDSYYSFSPIIQSGRFKNVLKKLRMKLFLGTRLSLFSPSFGYWLQRLQPELDDRIADIGCGSGQLLYELWVSGFKKLVGVDPFLDQSQTVGEGFSLVKGELSDLDGEFDLIMMHHAFEHMTDPGRVLETCRQKLKPGGQLLIRVPLAGTAAWEEFGVNWVQLDAPRHLAIPSKEGFLELSRSQGLKLREVVFDSEAFQFWGSELYQKGIQLLGTNPEDHFTRRKLDQFHKKALQYNQEGIGDQVCFYLERAD